MKLLADFLITKRTAMIAWTALCWLLSRADASTIVGLIDWDPPPSVPWVADGDASITVQGGADQWLQISFTGDPLPEWVLASGSATDLFAGAWSSDAWIEFDFWASSSIPDALQIRWGSASTNVWGNTLTPSVSGIGSWQTLRTDTLGSVTDWNIGLGDPDEFVADLSSIDWIGLYIYRDGTDPEVYGVDDVSLMVPEPAEVLLLCAAFGVVVLVLRRRRQPSAVNS